MNESYSAWKERHLVGKKICSKYQQLVVKLYSLHVSVSFVVQLTDSN